MGENLRVLRIKIDNWRNLRHIEFSIPEESTLVCLVGENGTGKSNMLELISASAQHLGVAAGFENSRGNPLEEEHSFEVVVRLPEDAADLLAPTTLPQFAELTPLWDRTIMFRSRKSETERESVLIPGGMERSALTDNFVSQIVSQLRARAETQHLYLDADRSYPPYQVQPHQYAELLSQPWESPEWTKQWAFRTTRTLYEEWIKFFLAQESRAATRLLSEIRRAREAGTSEPVFDDHFESYKESVSEVLPHLRFVGVETETATRTLLFDTAGIELSFSKLSGGEREISFLIGQIERFQLRRGLLLIDEPELHLNPDLLRTWLAFLRDTIEEGQVWIATHSLEAVEVAGHQASFVMEREGESRIVDSVAALSNRPVVTALSAAIGAPAFSLSKLRFVFIEGDRQTRERERYYAVCGEPTVNRFLEGGSCDEVVRRLGYVRELAAQTDEQLRVGGVIDRDFRTDEQVSQLAVDGALYVLECHEVENVFLEPGALQVLLQRLGSSSTSLDLLRDASDQFAGMWIVQRTATRNESLVAPNRKMREIMGRITWAHLVSGDEALNELVDVQAEQHSEWRSGLEESISAYGNIRDASTLWLECLGKQVLSRLPKAVGLTDAVAMERQVVQMWEREEVELPSPVGNLRGYLSGLTS